MLRFASRPLAAALCAALTSGILAQPGREAPAAPPTIPSGPQAGTALGALEVHAPVGPEAGQTFDLAERLRQGPAAILFVHELTRNVAPLMREFDDGAALLGAFGLHCGLVMLHADRTAGEAAVQRAWGAMRMRVPMLISTDGVDGPGSYALERRCTLTLVLADDGKVVNCFGLTDVGPQDAPWLQRELEELAGAGGSDDELRAALDRRYPDSAAELKDTVVALMRAAKRARARPAGRGRPMAERSEATAVRPGQPVQRERRGQAPDDPRLRELLRAAIQKTATKADLDEVFASIAEHAGKDKGLNQQVRAMFELMISLGYGTDDARARAQAWIDEHGDERGGDGGR